MRDLLKNFGDSTHIRSALIAGLGMGLGYVAQTLATGVGLGDWRMVLAAAGSVAVNAIWQNLKSPAPPTPSPTPPAPAPAAA